MPDEEFEISDSDVAKLDENPLLTYLRATMPSDEKVAEYKAIYDVVDWHEPGRHGVIRDIPKNLVNQIYEAMVYYLGSKCGWTQKNDDGTTNIEFVHMAKVYPGPKRPWEWCGETILFKDWQAREMLNRNLLNQFDLGDDVQFEYDGVVHVGKIINMRKRATVLVGNRKFYIPASMLNKLS